MLTLGGFKVWLTTPGDDAEVPHSEASFVHVSSRSAFIKRDLVDTRYRIHIERAEGNWRDPSSEYDRVLVAVKFKRNKSKYEYLAKGVWPPSTDIVKIPQTESSPWSSPTLNTRTDFLSYVLPKAKGGILVSASNSSSLKTGVKFAIAVELYTPISSCTQITAGGTKVYTMENLAPFANFRFDFHDPESPGLSSTTAPASPNVPTAAPAIPSPRPPALPPSRAATKALLVDAHPPSDRPKPVRFTKRAPDRTPSRRSKSPLPALGYPDESEPEASDSNPPSRKRNRPVGLSEELAAELAQAQHLSGKRRQLEKQAKEKRAAVREMNRQQQVPCLRIGKFYLGADNNVYCVLCRKRSRR
ncbi:hypothetical protein BXZ70DRAFT_565678 [Cristinia sonorae]|uniref:Uncharacterized protein n=1 Tax=Cristinia sonorae TaxID=1940300 RepID=A0A8K0XKV4_9AGAR|nr:hypothetical protein BXZ70DRAFT_565678 [Cristinia sonorae]